jgi:hypothetical protein
MTRLLPAALTIVLLLPATAIAQQQGAVDHGVMDHGTMSHMVPDPTGVTEGGQSAFAAIEEIVSRLGADPSTDWNSVDIEGLRQHLIDMDNVTLHAQVVATPTDTGERFEIWSDDPAVRASIQRMVLAHVATMNGVNGWALAAAKTERGAALDVAGTAANATMIRGLGFIGVMTLGSHHQAHHLAMATGHDPHM